jgi:hypothetical protein
MASIAIEDILKKNGLDMGLLHNPGFTKQLAKELTRRGYRRIQRMVNGERKMVWTNEAYPQFDIKFIVDNVLGPDDTDDDAGDEEDDVLAEQNSNYNADIAKSLERNRG